MPHTYRSFSVFEQKFDEDFELIIPSSPFYNRHTHHSMVDMGLVKFLNFPQESLKLAESSLNTFLRSFMNINWFFDNSKHRCIHG